MTIKKRLLRGATISFCALALTVPMTFAACPVQNDCGCDKTTSEIVTPDNATCSKCKKSDCGCKKQKKSKCDPCEKKKSDCGCPTGAAAPCIQKKPLNQQTYAYPNAIYSHSNSAIVGEEMNNAQTSDMDGSLLDYNYNGVPVECGCPTGAAAPVINSALMPKYDCAAAPNVYSTTNMDIITLKKEPFSALGFTGAAADISAQQYPDVYDSYWASGDINRLTEQCVLEGYPDGMFKPNRKVSRAEMATMVVKGYNLDVTSPCDNLTFRDVPRNHWAYSFISKGVAENMIKGKSADRFAPNESISRTEALTIMSKGLSCPMDENKANQILSQYKDGAKVPCWARECVAKAIENGALKNERNQDFIRPNDITTRAEASSMLQSMRIAGGYDKSTKTASQDLGGKTYIERETKVTIPTLELTMNDIVNAKHVNVGEQFSATTINEITINGQTFPCGSTVRGKVTEVVRPSKNDQGMLKLSFNEIIGCDGCKTALPKQILTARVERQKEINPVLRLVQLPFTWAGSIIGTAGRTVGGAAIGLSNAAEALLDQTGVGTSELLSAKFKAAGRSYQDGLKTVFRAPVDLTRTALSGTLGLLQTTGDEIAYLVDGSGVPIAKVNPKEKITIAFGK